MLVVGRRPTDKRGSSSAASEGYKRQEKERRKEREREREKDRKMESERERERTKEHDREREREHCIHIKRAPPHARLVAMHRPCLIHISNVARAYSCLIVVVLMIQKNYNNIHN